MKTKKEIVEAQEYKILDECDIYTLEEFMKEIEQGSINQYDGNGFFTTERMKQISLYGMIP